MSHTPSTTTDGQTLEQRAAELRETIARPTPQQEAAAELAALERQLAEQREATAVAAAERRLLGITRADRGLTAAVDAGEARLAEAAAHYVHAVELLNEHYAKLERLRAEADALRDRFPGLAAPALPRVIAPEQRPACVEAARAVAAVSFAEYRGRRVKVEKCEHGVRERRSYREIEGTPAFEIIQAAGLPPWPPLTAAQQQILAQRERDRVEGARQAQRFATEAAAIQALPSSVPARRF